MVHSTNTSFSSVRKDPARETALTFTELLGKSALASGGPRAFMVRLVYGTTGPSVTQAATTQSRLCSTMVIAARQSGSSGSALAPSRSSLALYLARRSCSATMLSKRATFCRASWLDLDKSFAGARGSLGGGVHEGSSDAVTTSFSHLAVPWQYLHSRFRRFATTPLGSFSFSFLYSAKNALAASLYAASNSLSGALEEAIIFWSF
mmetsp:Transcript_37169/g.97458  ORF Transcript_37169/g.97458 Transcript_37169/m.97458 type:complete len:206 (-) Transcript_37169:414-1031(-)